VQVPSILFTLILGVLAGIAALGGSAPFETVLLLGVLGVAHMAVVAGRHTREVAFSRVQRGD
jgi:hypothetical protein